MGLQIESGGTRTHTAIVNEKGQLLTESASVDGLASAARDGYGFYIITDFVTITSNTEFSGMLWFQNLSGERNLHIAQLRTCGLDTTQWKVIKNPTTGTLIDTGGKIKPENLKFSSGITFNGLAKAGDGTALTITDGTTLATWINRPGHSVNYLNGAITLGTNNSIALVCKPVAVNVEVCVSILAYYSDPVGVNG